MSAPAILPPDQDSTLSDSPSTSSVALRKHSSRSTTDVRWRRGWPGPVLILPAVIVFGVYFAYPVIVNIGASFFGETEAEAIR